MALVESAPGARSAQELRGMYSMVIIRAINGPLRTCRLTTSLAYQRVITQSTFHRARAGLVEGQQTKFYAEPVNVLAGRLGLPQWLVDLRHEATHSQVRAPGEQ